MALTATTDGAGFGASTAYHSATASTNLNNVKAAPGTILSISVSNINATVYYLQLFNLVTAPAASDATGFVETIPIPANTAVGGREIHMGARGQGFSAGIAIKICGGAAGNDNSNAATGVYVSIRFL